MKTPEIVAHPLGGPLRRLRWRRQLCRAAAEVRRSAERGEIDSRAADRLQRYLEELREDIGSSGRTS